MQQSWQRNPHSMIDNGEHHVTRKCTGPRHDTCERDRNRHVRKFSYHGVPQLLKLEKKNVDNRLPRGSSVKVDE